MPSPKPLLYLLLVALSAAISYNAYAQKAIRYDDVSKIIISEKSGGMGGSASSVSEITRQNGIWTVFNTEEVRTYDAFLSRRHPNFSRKGIHVFVKTLNKQTVADLISALQMHLVSFKPAVLGITSEYLKANANKLWPSFRGFKASQRQFFLSQINQSHIDSAIVLHFSGYGTDVFSDCTVKIVKKNHDTVEMQAEFQHAYMLPWVINKHDTTYNERFSKFVVAALGQDSTCNLKPLLRGEHIYHDIYDFIYRRYCDDIFMRQDYEQQYPQAFALIKKYFYIDDLRSGSLFAFLRLQPRALPSNIYLDDALHVGNMDSVKHAIGLIDAMAAILKKPNFVFKKALDNPQSGTLVFVAPGDSTTLFPNEKGDFPYLMRFDNSQVITFRYASKTVENEYSLWYLLPNGKLVLNYFEGDSVLGIPKQTIENYRYRGTFNLFDREGEPLKNQWRR